MGFKKWFNAQNERHEAYKADAPYRFVYGTHLLADGIYRYSPAGARVEKPILGATAEFDKGMDHSSPTLTRIAAGAMIAGPAGAVVGGLFKKQRGRAYVYVTFPDGEVAVIDGAAKDENKLRDIVQRINAAGAHYK